MVARIRTNSLPTHRTTQLLFAISSLAWSAQYYLLGFGGAALAIALSTWLASSLPLFATLLGTWALFMMGNVGMRKQSDFAAFPC